VEGFCASFCDAVLAPELVFLRAVLCVGVGDYVSAMVATEDHDPSHLVMREVSLVDRNVGVSQFYDDVAGLAVVDCVEYSLVAFLRPLVRHEPTWGVLLEIVCNEE
jgi:hypothetical protein